MLPRKTDLTHVSGYIEMRRELMWRGLQPAAAKAAKQGSRAWQSGEQEIWVRQLDGGDRAVAVFNRAAAPAAMNVQWASLCIILRRRWQS